MRPRRWEIWLSVVMLVPLLTGQWAVFVPWLGVLAYGLLAYGLLILIVAPDWFRWVYRYLSAPPHTDKARPGWRVLLSRWR